MENEPPSSKSDAKEREKEEAIKVKAEKKLKAKEILNNDILETEDTHTKTDLRRDLDKDYLRVGWTLDEEDLLCLPLVQDKTPAEEYRVKHQLLLNSRKPYHKKERK